MLRLAAEWIYVFPQLHDVAIEMVEAAVVSNYGNTFNDLDQPTIGTDGKLPWLGHCFEDAFRNVPALGASLGLQDSNSAGTLGRYLAIHTVEEFDYMALTCHHVLSRMFSLPCPIPQGYTR